MPEGLLIVPSTSFCCAFNALINRFIFYPCRHKDAVFDTCNSNSSHFCSGRNYHGFVVNFVSKDSSRIKTQYRIWHKREDEDPFDETKPRFNVYGLIKVEECGCQDLWQQKLQ
eukprot:scaffold73784_cov19-Tisochrysis_lutea.AAC.3